MNCRNIHDQLPDIALGLTPVPPEVEAHLGECRECADTLQALRSTMNLLDEWQAPEPSPYWDVRMQARLREEQQRASAGWLQWLRRPALSLAAALGLVIGIGVIQMERFLDQGDNPPDGGIPHHGAHRNGGLRPAVFGQEFGPSAELRRPRRYGR